MTTIPKHLARPSRLPVVEYRIGWVWAYEPDHTIMYDHYPASTAPRAISKFMKMMNAEYANAWRDLRIISVQPSGR